MARIPPLLAIVLSYRSTATIIEQQSLHNSNTHIFGILLTSLFSFSFHFVSFCSYSPSSSSSPCSQSLVYHLYLLHATLDTCSLLQPCNVQAIAHSDAADGLQVKRPQWNARQMRIEMFDLPTWSKLAILTTTTTTTSICDCSTPLALALARQVIHHSQVGQSHNES